ncbi:hypothetical protein QFZ20_002184 [Flavobacterium sp. W4I14]|nr:hypothetical protein [Flavobacterium sp. W4I14]
MKKFIKPGMITKELDDSDVAILNDFGAKSAPFDGR